jgi:hypothetical protein
MGYFTRYSLDVVDGNHADIEQALILLAQDESLFELETKWYEHEAHCIAVSAANPTTFIILHGVGDEVGDIWRTIYYKGKQIDHWDVDTTPPNFNFEAFKARSKLYKMVTFAWS